MTPDPRSAAEPAPGSESTPDSPGADPVAQDGAWKRWMPRRRTPADAELAADSPTVPAAGDESVDTAVTATVAPAAPQEPPTPEADAAPAPRRRLFGRRTPPAQTAPPAALAEGEEPAGDDAETREDRDGSVEGGVNALRRRRKRLLRDREVAVYHLGGLAYELHRRDMLDQGVLRLRAEAIGMVDETVHAIDLRLEELAAEREERRGRRGAGLDPTAGNCLTCRAPFSLDARFCWQCGSRLAPGAEEQITAMIAERRP